MPSYEFAPGTEKNSYIFPTKLGWLYTVSFKESAGYFIDNEILYNSSLVFEISFLRSASDAALPQKGADILVKETILTILLNHIEGQGHLPLYLFICYSADEKEAARSNLFLKWYESIDPLDWQFYRYDLQDSGSTIYFGLFVNLKHPSAQIIPDEFENFVQKEKNVLKELFRRR